MKSLLLAVVFVAGIQPAVATQFEVAVAESTSTIVCYAQDSSGDIFAAAGITARSAQRKAVNDCRDCSRTHCRAVGCDYAEDGLPQFGGAN